MWLPFDNVEELSGSSLPLQLPLNAGDVNIATLLIMFKSVHVIGFDARGLMWGVRHHSVIIACSDLIALMVMLDSVMHNVIISIVARDCVTSLLYHHDVTSSAVTRDCSDVIFSMSSWRHKLSGHVWWWWRHWRSCVAIVSWTEAPSRLEVQRERGKL